MWFDICKQETCSIWRSISRWITWIVAETLGLPMLSCLELWVRGLGGLIHKEGYGDLTETVEAGCGTLTDCSVASRWSLSRWFKEQVIKSLLISYVASIHSTPSYLPAFFCSVVFNLHFVLYMPCKWSQNVDKNYQIHFERTNFKINSWNYTVWVDLLAFFCVFNSMSTVVSTHHLKK